MTVTVKVCVAVTDEPALGRQGQLVGVGRVAVSGRLEVGRLGEDPRGDRLEGESERAGRVVDAEVVSVGPGEDPVDAGPVLLRGRREGRHARPTVLWELDALRPGDRRELDHVLQGDDEIRRVRFGAIAHLHRDLVGPVRVGVVGRLVVLGRTESQYAALSSA